MWKLFAVLILKMWGWTIKGRMEDGLKKSVIIAAPHTANSDFAIGWLAYKAMGVNVNFLIKKEMFRFPFGALLKSMGGIPVDRSKSTNTVSQVVDLINRNESIHVALTPEGTRKRVKHWRKGFYFIAHKANIPVVLVSIDYAKKEGAIGPTIYLTNDYDADLAKIQEFYKNVSARHPENFNLTPIKEEKESDSMSTKKLQQQYCCKK